MAKKLVCSTAVLIVLAFVLTGLALAQVPAPTATTHEQGLTGAGAAHGHSKTPPGTIFYGGDGDPTNPNQNGLWANDSSYFGESASVYSPFLIGKNSKWNITGLFTNVEYYPTTPTVDGAAWAIVSLDKTTIPPIATTVCSGVDTAPVLTDTGRLYFGTYEEFTTAVAVGGCALKGGKAGAEYWESITLQTSVFQLAYESGVSDSPPPNSIGTPEPLNDSYFYGPQFGAPVFVNANSQGPGFNSFSAGVVGTASK